MQFAVNRAGGAALGAKRRPIQKIERDGDKVLGGRRFFYFSATTNQKMAFAMEGVLGRVRDSGGTRGGGVSSLFGAMA